MPDDLRSLGPNARNARLVSAAAADLRRPALAEAFARYETTLVTNDVEAPDALFWSDPRTVRHGPRESLYGRGEILAFRKARPAQGPARALTRTALTTYGRDMGVASAAFVRPGTDRMGRQMQTWMRTPEGWRVVAAHVSRTEP